MSDLGGRGDLNADKVGETLAATQGKYAELPVRIASALVLAGFALYATWAGGPTFDLLLTAASILIFLEFRSIVKTAMPFRVGLFAFAFLVLFIAAWFAGIPLNGTILCAAGALVLAVWEYLIRKSVWGATALVYAALPFLALASLRQGEYGFEMILLLFAIVWGADTLAYFSGKTFGGPKLAPMISPKKTWSGFLGGLLGAVLAASAVMVWAGLGITVSLIAMVILLAVLSQIGDLYESSVKRKFGVKDSGRIIPGHGGILDRIDGLIFAACAAFLTGIYFCETIPLLEGTSTAIFNMVNVLPN